MDRKAILIMGMHRAGTSALARVCSLRGADLPAHVLPANAGNEHGYWEPQGVVELNDRILDFFDLAWDDPFAESGLPPLEAFPDGFRVEARQLVQREYGDSGLFVLKDPRCTLLQAFWIDVLRSLGIRPCPVVVMRPCGEVLASLVRRDRTSAVGAGLLYVAYGLAAMQASEHAASFVTYGQLMSDWRDCTARIAAEQDFSWPQGDSDSSARIQAYLQPSLPAREMAGLPEPLATWTQAIWEWFCSTASGHAPPPSQQAWVRNGLTDAATLFAPVLRDRTRRLRETDALRVAATTERDAALKAYRDTDGRLRKTQSDFRERDRACAAAEADAAAAAVEASNARAEAVIATTAAEAARAEADTARAESFAARAEVVAAKSDADAARAKAVAAKSDADAARAEADAAKAEACAARAEAVAAKFEADAARAEADAARAALGVVYRESDELRRELSVMLESRSWKLTAPLRAAMRRVRGYAPADQHRLRQLLQGGNGPRAAMAAEDGTGADAQAGPLSRPHPELRDFLIQEFGEQAAADAVLRIDRYRLPVPLAESRVAVQVACTEEQAMAWACGIARLAEARRDLACAPDVSIVIPVYNQLPFTLACIEALLTHDTRYSFEILIGDDASTDATGAALAVPIRGIRHVRHRDNLGFVRNCNATARHASGRYVLFLNNDTQVLPSWLDELIGALESDPRIGLAGSKLIYPDGRLQECGAIVWRDGSAWNYGRLADPRSPEFCYLRDVDYVSGASIALRRELWQQLGGFDELFVPAYAEDADLAFRVRARGLRTVVQPLSQLLHFEGVSSGTDLGAGAKAYQVENLRKLRERWSHELQDHRENADSPEQEKERSITRRVLFVDHCTPSPKEDAGSLVALEAMKAFQDNGYKVTFIPEDNFAHMGGLTHDLQRLGIEPIYHPAYSTMDAFLARRDDPFDVIFLHRFGVGAAHMEALRRKYPAARVIFLNADLHYVRAMRQAELERDEAAKARARSIREQELRVIARADITLVHSAYERDLLATELPDARVELFPLIHDPVERVAALSQRDGVCFVGGFRHPPNADGITWFVDSIWPLVLAELPDARLHIVGSNITPEVQALAARDGVRIVGFVDDLAGFLDRRRVTIAPLRYGAGAKGKVAASLAQGVPAVCTPIAAEGMQLHDGDNVLIGASAEEFARHVVDLLVDDDRWSRLSGAGLAYAREITSRASAVRRIRDLVSPA